MSDEPNETSSNTSQRFERTPPTRAEFVAALGRVLTHAESHGEVYTGAQSDLAIVEEFVLDVLNSKGTTDDSNAGSGAGNG